MSDNPKSQVVRRRKRAKTEVVAPVGVLQQFDCKNLNFEFVIPLDSFNIKAFSKETGIKKDQGWSAVLPTDDRRSGYHVHFKGRIESKRVRLTIDYWEGNVKRTKAHAPPSAESIMQWVGSFVQPTSRALATAHFKKPSVAWRSLFNLPFKVTMANAEVVIDGVSLLLPKNEFRAATAFLLREEHYLSAAVQLFRTVEFAKFSLDDEVARCDEATKMFLEQAT